MLDCCISIKPLIEKDDPELDEDTKDKLEYLLFKILFTISALVNDEKLRFNTNEIVKSIEQKDTSKSHSIKFINELKCNCESWTDNAFDPIIFCYLVKEQGLGNEILTNVMTILKTCLSPNKDIQMRTKFLLLIPELFSSTSESSEKTFLECCFEEILNEMIIPNIAWKAGRSAGALRMTACASLVLLMQNKVTKTISLSNECVEKVIKMMLSTLDDDNKSTRLYVTRVFLMALDYYGQRLDKDQLHKLYPEFIKRLDDQCEEIRLEILKIFYIYFSCLNQNYDKILYQAHLQMIFENLLLYLDDANEEFQIKILSILNNLN